MIYFLALIPATGLTLAGYFALYLSTRMEGGLRTFGKYLGVWAFTLAALVVLGAIFAAAHGHRHGMRMHGMYGRMHGPWPGRSFSGPPMPPRGDLPHSPVPGAPPPPPPANGTTPDSSATPAPASH
jgi:hypothetical protein